MVLFIDDHMNGHDHEIASVKAQITMTLMQSFLRVEHKKNLLSTIKSFQIVKFEIQAQR